VVDQFSTFIEGGDLDGHVVVFIGPFFVSGLSFGGSDFDGTDGFIIILFSLFKVNFSLSQDCFVFSDGGLELFDFGFGISDGSF
jgi:hypothetical protein